MRRAVTLRLAVLGLLAAGVSPATAQAPSTQQQQQQQAPAYKVGTVTIKFVGTANVNEQVVRANMQIREGGDFDDQRRQLAAPWGGLGTHRWGGNREMPPPLPNHQIYEAEGSREESAHRRAGRLPEPEERWR